MVSLVIALFCSFPGDANLLKNVETQAIRSPTSKVIRYPAMDPKIQAIHILENKCNVCHRKRNKRRVFTLDNMNGWANDVHIQVFLKKRMPKGKDIKLTEQEYHDLLTWISSTKSNYYGLKP